MSIQNKIEQIRNKPEYIRLRYAWGMTFFCLFIIIIIWFISFSAQKENSQNTEALKNQQEIINDFKQNKESITDTAGKIKNILDDSSSVGKAGENNDNMTEKVLDNEL